MGILGFIVMIALVVGGIVHAGFLSELVGVPSAIITVGVWCAALLMSFGKGCSTAIRAVFSRTASREMLALGVAVFERGQSYAVGCGVLGTLVGTVIMLSKLDDPARIGPGLAVALLTLIYGLFLAYGILLPIVASLRRRLGEMEGTPS